MEDLVSIIITVFNSEKYLKECLDSVCVQTYLNIEIIIVNDGSEDNSLDICRDYSARDPRIRIIDGDNRGVVEARKAGYLAAKGSFVSIIDSDDWLEPDMIERLFRACSQSGADVSMCGRYEETGSFSRRVCQGIKPGFYSRSGMSSEIFPQMIVNGSFFEWGIFPSFWDKLFRREVLSPFILEVSPWLPMGNDAACVYPSLMKADSICIIPECLYHYRQSSGSMVRSIGENEAVRNGFIDLYQKTDRVFERERNVFDFRQQWLEYVLFLMVPRSDALYEGIEELDFLFPFKGVKKGSRVILYGMGLFGQRLYRYIEKTDFCEIAGAFDRNHKALCSEGLPVRDPDEIGRFDCDEIVVTLSYARNISEVRESLSAIFPAEHIHTLDIEFIKEEKNLKAFGLI